MMILKTMMWTTMIQEAACKTRQVLARIDQESVLIFCDKTYWRKISGHLWVPQRGGERRRPRRDPCIWGETDKDPQVFRIPFASNHLNLWGLAWHHLQVTADILEAAEEGVKQLAGARGEHHHFNLQYVESAKTQVQMPVTGTVLKDRWTAFYASMHWSPGWYMYHADEDGDLHQLSWGLVWMTRLSPGQTIWWRW